MRRHADELVEAKRNRRLRACLFAHKRVETRRKIAFFRVRITPPERFSREKPENAVAKEFQPFEIAHARARKTRMRQGPVQQRVVGETMANPLFERFDSRGRHLIWLRMRP